MPDPSHLLTPNRVLDACAAATGVTVSRMVTKRRSHSLVEARQLAMFLLRELTDLSLPEVGALLGGRDHSTVVYGIRCVRTRMAADPIFSAHVDQVRAACLV